MAESFLADVRNHTIQVRLRLVQPDVRRLGLADQAVIVALGRLEACRGNSVNAPEDLLVWLPVQDDKNGQHCAGLSALAHTGTDFVYRLAGWRSGLLRRLSRRDTGGGHYKRADPGRVGGTFWLLAGH